MSLHTTIEKYSHFFVVKNPTKNIYPVIYQLSSKYTQFGMKFDPYTKKQKWGPLKTFAIYVERGSEFRFHIGQYQEFMDALLNRYIDKSSYSVIEHPVQTPEKIDIKLKDGWELRDYQQEAHDFIVEETEGNFNSPLVMIQTGGGKTVTALAAAATLKYRFAVVVLASYVDKWIGDISEILKIDKSEIAAIRGSDALQRCTRYPESNLPIPKAFVISISTIANWYKFYEERRDHPSLEAYSCKPWEFFSHLGIGTVIFDEVHQHPHAVYRIYTYLHAPRTISLSATLLTKDPTLQKVQAMMFPHHRRYDKLKLKRYITVHACAYQISNFINSHIRTTEYGQNSYSQTAFEKSILKHRNLSKQYLDMIADLVQSSYIEGKMEGDKLAIFVGSAKMADAVVGILKKRFNGLDIRTYLERDPYENAIAPDVRVSTILSLGTAVDIPQLRVSIMTNSIESPIANVQTLGRLRELKDRDVRFYYLYCSTIPKHQEYHLKKIDLFSSRVKEHKQLFLRTLYP